MRAGYGKNTRSLLTKDVSLKIVIDFGDLPIFDATTYPAILLMEKRCPIPDDNTLAATFTDVTQLSKLEETLDTVGFRIPLSALKIDGWTLEQPEILSLMEKLEKRGQPLGEYVGGKFYYGIKTGLNEAFVIDEQTRSQIITEDPKSEEIMKLWLRGRDIRKWRVEKPSLYLLYVPWHFPLERYPAVLKYLSKFKKQLENRTVAERGKYEWYALQRYAADYNKEFERNKIIYPDIAQHSKFTWDESNAFVGNTAYIIPTDEKWLVGLLNSKAIWWFYLNISSTIRGGFVRFITQYMEKLPIPKTSSIERNNIVERVEKLLSSPNGCDVPRLESEIDDLVYELYGLNNDEISIIEGGAR